MISIWVNSCYLSMSKIQPVQVVHTVLYGRGFDITGTNLENLELIQWMFLEKMRHCNSFLMVRYLNNIHLDYLTVFFVKQLALLVRSIAAMGCIFKLLLMFHVCYYQPLFLLKLHNIEIWVTNQEFVIINLLCCANTID